VVTRHKILIGLSEGESIYSPLPKQVEGSINKGRRGRDFRSVLGEGV